MYFFFLKPLEKFEKNKLFSNTCTKMRNLISEKTADCSKDLDLTKNTDFIFQFAAVNKKF
jgi:hypothetical protein